MPESLLLLALLYAILLLLLNSDKEMPYQSFLRTVLLRMELPLAERREMEVSPLFLS